MRTGCIRNPVYICDLKAGLYFGEAQPQQAQHETSFTRGQAKFYPSFTCLIPRQIGILASHSHSQRAP